MSSGRRTFTVCVYDAPGVQRAGAAHVLEQMVEVVQRGVVRDEDAIGPAGDARGALADVGHGEGDRDGLAAGGAGRQDQVRDAQVRLAVGIGKAVRLRLSRGSSNAQVWK